METASTPVSPAARGLDRLFQLVDGSSLALFRILFGLIALNDAWWLWPKLKTFALQETAFRFRYPGFEWVPAWSGSEKLLAIGLAVAAAGVALGLLYRLAAFLLFLGYACVLLLDQSFYANQYWWMCLLALLMSGLPANRVWAVDGLLWKGGSAVVPAWAPLSVAVFTAIPLLYMGVSRLNPDWLSGYPLLIWFKQVSADPKLWPFLRELLATPLTAKTWSWFGVALHLLVVPMAVWRPTRWLAVALMAVYYAGLSLAFRQPIIVLPAFAGLIAFFPPDGPRRLFARNAATPGSVTDTAAHEAGSPWAFRGVALLLIAHALIPARSLVYPGAAVWTGEGYRFAWRTMLDDKYCEIRYFARDTGAGKSTPIEPRKYLTGAQFQELNARPDMMPQFARQLAERLKADRNLDAQILARAKCSLNSRPYSLLVDPGLDLAKIEPGTPVAEWVKPMEARFPPGWRVVGPGR